MNKDTLLKQFDRCYNENGWFAAIRNAIDGINVEQATFKPEDSVNCIWESLSHLTYYNNAYLQRFKGFEFKYDVSDNDETFNVGECYDEEWLADVKRFDSVMSEFRDQIAWADEAKLQQAVSSENFATWAQVISDINAHNAYHGGQMVLLRKMQGAWRSDDGVD